MSQRKTLEETVQDTYDDPDVASWVLDQIDKAGTAEAIARGERVLPHPVDARRNYEREQGIKDIPQDPGAKDALIMDLSKRLAAVEQAQQQKAGS